MEHVEAIKIPQFSMNFGPMKSSCKEREFALVCCCCRTHFVLLLLSTSTKQSSFWRFIDEPPVAQAAAECRATGRSLNNEQAEMWKETDLSNLR